MTAVSRTRTVLACLALTVAVVATTASGTESKSGNGPSQGLGASDATGDISGLTIVREATIAVTYGQVTITNNSSKRSDYFVTIAAESPDGATRYDDTIVSVLGLDPGQTTTDKGLFTKEIPADAVLKLIEVQRTASI